MRGLITISSGHFAKASPTREAVVTPFALASGQAANTIPFILAGSPTATGLSRYSGWAAFSTEA
ncbi:hypothetical protein D3C71_1120550 [compost metagenome]